MCVTKVVLSPFGYGEICWRDFEVMLAGAVLFKQRMEHLETWPEGLFEDGVTYVSHAWDFSNFDETLANLLDDPTRAVSIAETAQKRYIDVTLGGAEIFVNRFASLSCLFAASRRTQPEAEPGAKV
jgi:hypothetical protein